MQSFYLFYWIADYLPLLQYNIDHYECDQTWPGPVMPYLLQLNPCLGYKNCKKQKYQGRKKILASSP